MQILLVEDDKKLNEALTFQLEKEGFQVDTCFDGEEALYYIQENIYDLILLDRMLPHLSGTHVLQKIRQTKNPTPVILITALGTLEDKVEGLDLGADDYLVKPFAFEELMARIRCIARRPRKMESQKELHFADLLYFPEEMLLTSSAGSCTLSKRESALLEFFLRNPKQTLSRSLLLNRVWGIDSDVEDGNLDNYIHFLRRRLKTIGSIVRIQTIRGIGYYMES